MRRRSAADWGDFAPRELTDRSNRLSYVYGVMLNRKGEAPSSTRARTARSSLTRNSARAILAEPGAKAWQIFDSRVVHLLEPRYQTSKPITANTIEDPDRSGSISTTRSRPSRRSTNTTPHAPRDRRFSIRPRRTGLSSKGLALEKTNWALKIAKAPFYAYSATGGNHVHVSAA